MPKASFSGDLKWKENSSGYTTLLKAKPFVLWCNVSPRSRNTCFTNESFAARKHNVLKNESEREREREREGGRRGKQYSFPSMVVKFITYHQHKLLLQNKYKHVLICGPAKSLNVLGWEKLTDLSWDLHSSPHSRWGSPSPQNILNPPPHPHMENKMGFNSTTNSEIWDCSF